VSEQVSFHEMAEHELNEAASYYDAQSPGLGYAFLDAIERVVNQILAHPNSGPLFNEVVRAKLVRRFPYSIMYSVQPEGIRILAIANHKRRPSF
jgi:toxin ParE1/3/4